MIFSFKKTFLCFFAKERYGDNFNDEKEICDAIREKLRQTGPQPQLQEKLRHKCGRRSSKLSKNFLFKL